MSSKILSIPTPMELSTVIKTDRSRLLQKQRPSVIKPTLEEAVEDVETVKEVETVEEVEVEACEPVPESNPEPEPKPANAPVKAPAPKRKMSKFTPFKAAETKTEAKEEPLPAPNAQSSSRLGNAQSSSRLGSYQRELEEEIEEKVKEVKEVKTSKNSTIIEESPSKGRGRPSVTNNNNQVKLHIYNMDEKSLTKEQIMTYLKEIKCPFDRTKKKTELLQLANAQIVAEDPLKELSEEELRELVIESIEGFSYQELLTILHFLPQR